MAERYPSTLRLLVGREVKVVKVHYLYAKNVWRVEYEGQKGCLAELFDSHWEEVDRDTVRQRHPTPLRAVDETYNT